MVHRGVLPEAKDSLAPFLKRLRDLPFVRKARVHKQEAANGRGPFDAVIRLETDAGPGEYIAEIKRSYLDRPMIYAIVSRSKHAARRGRKLLLLARYVPRPTALELIDAGVDFVDLAGNMHVSMQPHHHWTVIGYREQADHRQQTPRTAATLKVVFTMAAFPESATWTVRELAATAGVSKSKAASARRELLREGVVRDVRGQFRSSDPEDLTDQLLFGYRQILRPRLVIGRFRPPEQDPQEFLARLEKIREPGFRYSLTGGPAAYRLQKFYRGPEAPIFVDMAREGIARRLRLLPDREGPVTLLKAFGDLVFWRNVAGADLAHPWLIYAELMAELDPRAQEAGEELYKEFLAA